MAVLVACQGLCIQAIFNSGQLVCYKIENNLDVFRRIQKLFIYSLDKIRKKLDKIQMFLGKF